MKENSTLEKHAYKILMSFTLLILGTGTVFYHYVERFDWLNSYYFSVITLTTVGYGDFTPHTVAGKIFTTFYVLIGIGIVTTFISTLIKRRTEKMHERHEQHRERD